MTVSVTLYTRAGCCLCADMKALLDEVADDVPFRLSEVDVDSDPDLQARFGDSVPVLFVDGRKAFKYRATAGSESEAETIATALLDERLAACVNVGGPMRSLYRWQGRIADDREWQLVIKTQLDLFDTLADRVRALHSYNVPEIIGLPVTAGCPAYLAWLEEATRPRR